MTPKPIFMDEKHRKAREWFHKRYADLELWLKSKRNQPLTYEGHERWKLLKELIAEVKEAQINGVH